MQRPSFRIDIISGLSLYQLDPFRFGERLFKFLPQLIFRNASECSLHRSERGQRLFTPTLLVCGDVPSLSIKRCRGKCRIGTIAVAVH